MKRTTLYLAPDLDVLLRLEVQRQKRPMAEIVRDAVRAYVTRQPQQAPPGAGAFASGRADTADRTGDALEETGFGRTSAPRRRAARPRARAR